MARTAIKDQRFFIIGYIEDMSGGRQRALDAGFRILGYYDPATDKTQDACFRWYLTEAAACRILGRSRRPIKAATLKVDRSRIDVHIRPIIGHRLVVGLTRRDIENLQADIAAGRSAAKRKGRGGRTTGGIGVGSRTISTLRSLLGHAEHSGVIPSNPAQGVRQLATESRKRRLTIDDLERLGRTMRDAATEEEHPVGLGAIRVMLLTGFRRMEVLGLKRAWCSRRDHCVRFPDTKSGAQVRVIGSAALDAIERVPQHSSSRCRVRTVIELVQSRGTDARPDRHSA